MAIRFATMNDLPGLVEGASRMHVLTRFKHQPFKAQKVTNAFADLIQDKSGKYSFFVAIASDDEIAGALIGVLEQQIFSDAWTASVMHFDVLPEYRMAGYAIRLLRAFERWAENRNAFELSIASNSNFPGVDSLSFLERIGYQRVGGMFARLI